MRRLPRQSLAWRLFAAFVLLLLLTMILFRPPIPGAGFNWAGAKALYWSFAPVGLFGFAYGYQILSETFWRIYAPLFTLDISIRAITKVGWVPAARLFDVPENSRHSTLTILFGLALVASICMALLRYGGWLRRANDDLQVERPATIQRPSTKKKKGSRYSLVRCALACLAGAMVSALAVRAYIGEWNMGFAGIEFGIAYVALVCGGRSLANRLAAKDKVTLARGAAIGASIGAAVGAAVALIFAFALVGVTLLAHPAGLLVALAGVPFGALNGAATGLALAWLGNQSEAKAT